MTTAQEENKEQKELTDEQKAVLENGRVADLEKAVQEAAKKEEGKTDDKSGEKPKEELKKEEEKKPEEEKEDDGKWKEEFVQTGNEHADAAIELLKESGVTPVEANDIFKDAIESGDLTKVKWEILESRLGKAKAALVRTGVETYYNTQYKEQQEVVQYAHAEVGGEEGWKKVVAWSKSKEKADADWGKAVNGYRKALEIGGAAGKAAVDAIKRAYEADPKNSSLAPKMENGGKPTLGRQVDAKPLTRVEYFREMEKAGGSRAPEHVVRELRARRQAGIKAGM